MPLPMRLLSLVTLLACIFSAANGEAKCSGFASDEKACNDAKGCTFCTGGWAHTNGCYTDEAASRLPPGVFNCGNLNQTLSQPSVTTTTGVVLGTFETVKDGAVVASFKGIPYAESPTGENRFMPPKPHTSWTTPYNAISFGPGCLQDGHNADVPTYQSEDCLQLNVFSPDSSSVSNAPAKPVAVFFHGGGFKEGCSKGPFGLYESSFVAAHGDVVVVTANYRLGALGWVVTDGIEGNMGLKDQRLVLQWVQDNANAFGGDRDRVTIWGESAGAMSSLAHMYSPLSRHLFHQSLQESNPVGFVYRNVKQASAFGNGFAKILGCDSSGSSVEDKLSCMQSKNATEILAATSKADAALEVVKSILDGGGVLDAFLPWTPTVGTPDLPVNPMSAGSKVVSDVPTLIGTNTNEGATFILDGIKKKLHSWELDLILDVLFGHSFAKEVRARYPVAKGADARVSFGRILTDYWFRCASHKVAVSGISSRTFVYQYDHEASFAKSLWPKYGLPFCVGKVCHGAELPFVFHNTGYPSNATDFKFTAKEAQFSENIVSYWTNFFQTGNPNNGSNGVPIQWPVFLNSTRSTLLLNATLLKTTTSSDVCKFWEKKD